MSVQSLTCEEHSCFPLILRFAENFPSMEKDPLSLSSTPEPLTTELSEVDLQLERQAVRKLDYTILPIMSLFYLVSFLVCFWLFDKKTVFFF